MSPLWSYALKFGSLALFALGLGLFGPKPAGGETPITRQYRRYVAYLARSLRLLFLEGSGRRVVLGQLAALVVSGAAGVMLGAEYFLGLLPLVLLAPRLYL